MKRELVATLKVVTVVPIVKALPRATLSYFTKDKTKVGSFVSINVRGKEELGLVVDIKDARSVKTDLKNSSFALKKLSKGNDAEISKSFLRACERTAEFYATSLGSIIGAVIPKYLLESPELLSSHSKEDKKPETISEPFLIQLPLDERFGEYKTIIRESFAKNTSVLFITPTNEEALSAYELLSKGIEEFAFCTANESPKNIKNILKTCQNTKHPTLLIGTTSCVAFNRADLQTIILERENSRSFNTLSRPYIDIKTFVEFLARESGKTLIMGDSLLSMRSLWLEKQAQFAERSPLKWKVRQSADVKLIDMKALKADGEEMEFTILSNEMKSLVSKALSEKNKIFLFGARKGLAPTTVCKDCGNLLSCTNCKAPLVLHMLKNDERLYLCHACGAKRTTETRCDHCTSWNLVPLGIGTRTIAQELKKHFPNSNIYLVDKEHTTTTKQIITTIKKFMLDDDGILVGTELALLYLDKVSYVGIVSLDSLFSIPDFGINERIFYLVNRILEKCKTSAVVQTRNIGKEILNLATRGDILEFFRKEIQERKDLSYPPFTLFIKVSTEGTATELEQKYAYLSQTFDEFNPDFMRSKGMKSGKIILSMILRVDRVNWPKNELCGKLLLLSNEFLIKVDPISIL